MSEDIGPERENLKSRMQWSEEQLAGGDDNLFGNALYHNLGGGKFAEVSDRLGVETYWPWGASAADLNADGWQDLFITGSMNFPFRYGVNSVLLNNGGRGFLDSEFILGVEPRRDGRVVTPWFDLDCDGADKTHPQCVGRHGRVSVLAALGSRSSVVFDVDGDGDLDVITNDFNSAPQVLISDLAQQREVRFVKIKLIGSASNRDGLGARVTVVTPTRQIHQQHDGKSGYLSQSSLPLYFGLGDETKIERIEVRWPSGRQQTVNEPALGQLLEIREPQS
jgi:hypothetical protein